MEIKVITPETNLAMKRVRFEFRGFESNLSGI